MASNVVEWIARDSGRGQWCSHCAESGHSARDCTNPPIRPQDLPMREHVVAAMASFLERGSLAKLVRDRLVAIAKAKGLFRRSAIKPRSDKPLGVDGNDNFSTRKTAGTAFAERILQNKPLRPPMKRAG